MLDIFHNVVVYDYKDGRKVEWFTGVLLGWGTDYEELRDGAGTYTCAIVKDPQGNVHLVNVSMIRIL